MFCIGVLYLCFVINFDLHLSVFVSQLIELWDVYLTFGFCAENVKRGWFCMWNHVISKLHISGSPSVSCKSNPPLSCKPLTFSWDLMVTRICIFMYILYLAFVCWFWLHTFNHIKLENHFLAKVKLSWVPKICCW